MIIPKTIAISLFEPRISPKSVIARHIPLSMIIALTIPKI